MSAFFVTGAGTEIGKTYIASALLRAWAARGVACSALKPVVSGFEETDIAGSDPALLLNALGVRPTLERIAGIAPWRFRASLAPPIAAQREGKTIVFDEVAEFCEAQMRVTGGALLIEGVGGVMAPLTEGRSNIDLIEALEIPALYVAGSYLGAISHALTGLTCLDVRGVEIAAVIVSESAESVGLEETCALISAQRRGQRVMAAPRSPAVEVPSWAAELAAALSPKF